MKPTRSTHVSTLATCTLLSIAAASLGASPPVASSSLPGGKPRPGRLELISGATGKVFASVSRGGKGGEFGRALSIDQTATPSRFGVMVGAPGVSHGDGSSGALWAIDAFSIVPTFELTPGSLGIEPRARFGHSVTTLSHVDGDEFAWFAIGAPGNVDGSGPAPAVVVIAGDRTVQYVLEGAPGSLFGWALSGVADLDGDGNTDLAVGAPRMTLDGKQRVGRVSIFSGATGQPLFELDGELDDDHFGFALAVRCGSGFADSTLAVGAPGDGSAQRRGRVVAYDARTQQKRWERRATKALRLLGYSLTTRMVIEPPQTTTALGFWAGAPASRDRRGAVLELDCAGGSIRRRVDGSAPDQWLGVAVSSYVNTLANPLDQLLVGSLWDLPGNRKALRGGSMMIDRQSLAVIFDSRPKRNGGGAGAVFRMGFDRDGDGVRDALVGAPGPPAYVPEPR